MILRPALVVSAVLAVLLAAPLPAADAETTFSAIDTSTPGHAKGTISSTASYLRVRLSPGVPDTLYAVTDGVASYDLTTWGFDRPSVEATECGTTDPRSCAETPTYSPSFNVNDPTPGVTWPADTTIQAGQTPTITTSDPDGGGSLRVVWIPDDSSQDNLEQDVARNTTTSLTHLSQGLGTLLLKRCRDTIAKDEFHCRTALDPSQNPVSARLEVDRTVTSSGSVSPSAIGPGASSVRLNTSVSDEGTYVLDWQVRNTASTVVASGQSPATEIDSTKTKAFTLSGLPSLPSGSYSVDATMSRVSTAGDSFVSTVTGSPAFQVDATAPTVTGVASSTDTFFPAVDGYRDTAVLTVSGQVEAWRPAAVQVRNAGQVVRTLSADDLTPGDDAATFTWDGTDQAGHLVPAGTYSLHARATDTAGNTGDWVDGGTVTVDSRRLTTLTWQKAVSATDSLLTTSVGRCSVLRRPSAHLWAESIGLLSGYRCRSSRAADLLVSTQHRLTVPTVAAPGSYRTLAVSVYGGAARTKPSSTGSMRYFSNTDVAGQVRAMTAKVGYHPAAAVNAASLVRADHTVRWGTYTSGYRQYDVKHFLVTLTYTALR